MEDGHNHSLEHVSDRVLLWTVVINAGLSVFEFLAGVYAGSVALMADALHNTNDAAALIIAYIARKISRKGVDYKFTFGYRRAELIGAMIQLTALIMVGLYLVYEAVRRFFVPEPVLGAWMIAAAGVALLIDIATAWLLWAMSRGSMNVKAAFLHNMADAGASVAVLLGGASIVWLGWTWIDPTLTLVIAGYLLAMSFGLLKRTTAILMQGTPTDIDLDELKPAVEQIEGVKDLHHLHVWELDEDRRALEAHIVLSDLDGSQQTAKDKIKALLERQFGISHCTLEFEGAEDACADDQGEVLAKH